MSDPTTAITLWAAALVGVAGSGHCFAMCGGLAGAVALRTRAGAGPVASLRSALLHHAGRLSGYSIAGAVCGFFGAGIAAVLDLLRLATFLRMASGAILILIALRILSGWNALALLEKLGAVFWRKLQPLVRQTNSTSGTRSALLLGLLWGWLPCGMVYSMLLFAVLSGDAMRGAAVMAAFGLGTLPAMLASSLLFSQLHRRLRQHWPRMVTGVLLFAFGGWLAWTASPLDGRKHPPGAHHPNAMLVTNSTELRRERVKPPFRHSRESGNPAPQT